MVGKGWKVFASTAGDNGRARFLGVLPYHHARTARYSLRKNLLARGFEVEVPSYGTHTKVKSRSGRCWTLELRKN